jgi:hypothetical protein
MVNQVMSAKVLDAKVKKTGENEPVIFPIDPADVSVPPTTEPRAGSKCPNCKEGTIDYDGMLNLKCEWCGYSLAGCFT